ncbi:MAG: lamin tail domain-containing protein [Patescibacteria group bacterium]|nr:lamin tail domain-containing protein [Patescibacteria group bacterium]
MDGTINSASDEWMELKNISNNEIDLSNWQLMSEDGKININFSDLKTNKIMSGQFVLLERTDNDSVKGTANLIYKGALSNTNERLKLFDGQCNLIDEAAANPNWPAGDNSAKKTMERDVNGFGWHTSVNAGGTPKKENSIPQISTGGGGGGGGGVSTSPSSESSHHEENNNASNTSPENNPENFNIVINEIMYNASGSDIGREWIELFNKGTSTVNLAHLKLFEDNVHHGLNIAGEDKKLDPGAYAVISNDTEEFLKDFPDFNGILYKSSFSLKNTSDTFSLTHDDDVVADSVTYQSSWGANGDGNSLQLINGVWKAGKPTPGKANEISDIQPPAPTVQNFSISYDSNTSELSLSWADCVFGSNSTSSVIYKVLDIGNASSSLVAEIAVTSTKVIINEIGRKYDFSLQAFQDEKESGVATSSIEIPSFLKSAYFYNDPRSAANNLVEFSYNQYPFIPNRFSNSSWKAVIFYINQEAPKTPVFYSDQQYQSEISGQWGTTIAGAVNLTYPSCSSGNTVATALILPDSPDRCSIGYGGIRNSTLAWGALGEDNHLILDAGQNNPVFQNGDYITAAFYAYGGNNDQVLVVTDKNHYQYQTSAPVHAAPQLTGSLSLVFNKQAANLDISWPSATDADTIDSQLIYEIKFNNSENWQGLGNTTSLAKSVNQGDNLSISLRAKDEFGNVSNTLIAQWSYPTMPIYINQSIADGWSASFGTRYSANLQSITPNQDFQFNRVYMRFWQEVASDYTDLRLQVFGDNGNNGPDDANKLGEAIIANVYNPDQNMNMSFLFSNLISAMSGNKYWLVVDVAQYFDTSGYYRNTWRNAVNSATGDWYLKVGLDLNQ